MKKSKSSIYFLTIIVSAFLFLSSGALNESFAKSLAGDSCPDKKGQKGTEKCTGIVKEKRVCTITCECTYPGEPPSKTPMKGEVKVTIGGVAPYEDKAGKGGGYNVGEPSGEIKAPNSTKKTLSKMEATQITNDYNNKVPGKDDPKHKSDGELCDELAKGVS